MRAKDALGRFGEEVAAEHLRLQGLQILARNWRCPTGELDIVARDGSSLVICEVKTRRSTAFGYGQSVMGRSSPTLCPFARTISAARCAIAMLCTRFFRVNCLCCPPVGIS